MKKTNNMGLTVWDLTTDKFEHSVLQNNFIKIDQHNHAGVVHHGKYQDGDHETGPPTLEVPTAVTEITNYVEGNKGVAQWEAGGNGEAIRTPETVLATGTAIKPESIWRYLLARRSVGHNQLDLEAVWRENIKENAVCTAQIEDGCVTGSKLAKGILPLGIIVSWWKSPNEPNPGELWQICDGRTIGVNDMGVPTNTKTPDLRKKFIRGAISESESTQFEKSSAGGQETINLAHAHEITPHSHTVEAHSHGAGTLEFKIKFDGSHTHKFASGHVLHTRMNVTNGLEGNAGERIKTNKAERLANKQSAYIAAFNEGVEGDAQADMDPPVYFSSGFSEHNHGEWAGANGSKGSTAAAGSTTNAVGLTTDSRLSATTNIEPPWVGLVQIMKVKTS